MSTHFLTQQTTALVVGVASSAIFALLVWLATSRWIPRLREALSDDADLSGDWWCAVTTPDAQYAYEVKLKRRGGGWSGSASITRTSPSLGSYRHEFDVSARRRGAYVLLTLLGKAPHKSSLACGLLASGARGDELRGHWTYRQSAGTGVAGEDLVLMRR